MARIGFIGLGAMGGSLARRLVTRGFEVIGFDLSEDARQSFREAAGAAVDTPRAAIEGSVVVFTSLPTPELVESFWAENARHLDPGTTVIETSTIDPTTSRRVATQVLASEAENYIACTIGKTPAMALAGKAPLYVGAENEPGSFVRDVLEGLSDTVIDMGSVEGSTTFKLISNLIGMSNLAILAEGFALASAQGISGDVFKSALMTTGGWSVQADIRFDLIAHRDFKPRFAIDLAAKDLRLSVDAAARLGIPVATGAAAMQLFQAARLAGYGRDDAAAVFRVLDGDAS